MTTDKINPKESDVPYPINLVCDIFSITPEEVADFPAYEYIDYNVEFLFSKILTHREAKVIKSIYKDKRTLTQVGLSFGVQNDRIRQIKAKALRKLRMYDRPNIIVNHTFTALQNELYDLSTQIAELKRLLFLLTFPENQKLAPLEKLSYSYNTYISEQSVDLLNSYDIKTYSDLKKHIRPLIKNLTCDSFALNVGAIKINSCDISVITSFIERLNQVKNKSLAIDISELGLSKQSRKALQNANINTVQDFYQMYNSYDDILNISTPHGEEIADDIINVLNAYNFDTSKFVRKPNFENDYKV